MSVFRDAVKDYLDGEVDAVDAAGGDHKLEKPKRSDEVVVEKFSGLRIRWEVDTDVDAIGLSFFFIFFFYQLRNVVLLHQESGCIGCGTEQPFLRCPFHSFTCNKVRI